MNPKYTNEASPHGDPPILPLLQGVQRSGHGWKALCPAHGDTNPSLSITLAESGNTLLHCFAGCATEDVVHAVGAEMSILMAGAGGPAPSAARNDKGWSRYQDAAEFVARRLNGTVEDIHQYHGIDGLMRFVSVRIRTPKDKTFRVLHERDGRWHFGDPDRLLPLYRLPRLLPSPTVLIVEGERCVDAAAQHGIIATTSSHGANSAAKTDWLQLENKLVTIWPDNDQPGRDYAGEVVHLLRRVNPEIRIRLVVADGLPEGGDIIDWLKLKADAGMSSEAITTELTALLNAAVPWPDGDSTYSTYSTGPTSTFAPWPAPRPLPKSTPPPPFPINEAFPPACQLFRDYVQAVAHSYQVPLDLAVLLALAAFALALAKTIEVVAQGDWKEVLSIYVLVLLPSGERKSAVFARMISPIYHWQELQASGMAKEIATFENDIEVVKEKIRAKRRHVAKTDDEESDASLDDLLGQLADLEDGTPVPASMVASEATTEAIADMLVQNDERGMLAAPEGDAIDVMLGRYGTGRANFGLWLNGHAGDAVTIRRKGRKPLVLKRPVLCVALTIQPIAAIDLMSSREAEGRGVLGRFLFACPVPMMGYRELQPTPVPTQLSDWYETKLHKLLDRPVPAEPAYLRLSPAAEQVFLVFREKVEIELRPGGPLFDRSSFGSKLPGTILRIAAVLHGVANDGIGDGYIDAATMNAAISWADYLCDHERCANRVPADDAALALAGRIVVWFRRRELTTFSHNDAYNGVRGGPVRNASDIDAALLLLEEHGYIRPLPTPPRRKGAAGRPPSPRYEINPALHPSNSKSGPHNTHNTQNPGDAQGQGGAQ
jgi:hypothetical protein